MCSSRAAHAVDYCHTNDSSIKYYPPRWSDVPLCSYYITRKSVDSAPPPPSTRWSTRRRRLRLEHPAGVRLLKINYFQSYRRRCPFNRLLVLRVRDILSRNRRRRRRRERARAFPHEVPRRVGVRTSFSANTQPPPSPKTRAHRGTI